MPLTEPHKIISFQDQAIGLDAILVLDHLGLGPGAGGIRTGEYPSREAALADAKRLARSMTIKCALGGLDAGGAKMVVRTGPGFNRKAVFTRLGIEIERLGGVFRTAGDLGTTTEDLLLVAEGTQYVHTQTGSLVNSVARGHRRCVEAALKLGCGASLEGLSVGVQGCGDIGAAVVDSLAGAGARVRIADPVKAKVDRLEERVGVTAVGVSEVMGLVVDVLAPCAVGGVLNENSVEYLKAPVVCGAANNLLSGPRTGERLRELGVVVVPDLIASAGAVVDGIGATVMGLSDRTELIDGLGEVARIVLEEAAFSNRCTEAVALELANQRLSGRG